jgi:hypothetical protein
MNVTMKLSHIYNWMINEYDIKSLINHVYDDQYETFTS